MNNPDFTAIFYEACGGEVAPIEYELRTGPCRVHDLVFLSSLMHDARIRFDALDGTGNALRIPVNRDCWEYRYTRSERGLELHTAEAEFVLTGVLAHGFVSSNPDRDEPWMSYLWISEAYRDDDATSFELFIVGNEWRYRIELDKAAHSVVLRDLETPRLWEERAGR